MIARIKESFSVERIAKPIASNAHTVTNISGRAVRLAIKKKLSVTTSQLANTPTAGDTNTHPNQNVSMTAATPAQTESNRA